MSDWEALAAELERSFNRKWDDPNLRDVDTWLFAANVVITFGWGPTDATPRPECPREHADEFTEAVCEKDHHVLIAGGDGAVFECPICLYNDALARLKALTSDAAVEAAVRVWLTNAGWDPDEIAPDEEGDVGWMRTMVREFIAAAVATLPEANA